VIVKNIESSTINSRESGELKSCSDQTEQPITCVSEKFSETEEKLNELAKKSKHFILLLPF
jgi:hypothetical protein